MSEVISKSDIRIDHETKNITVNRCHECGEMKLAYEMHGMESFEMTHYRTVRELFVPELDDTVEIPVWKNVVVAKYICNDCHAKKVSTPEVRHFERPAVIPAGDCTNEQKLKWLEALQEMKDAFDQQVLIIADVTTPSGEWATKAALKLGIHLKHHQGVHL